MHIKCDCNGMGGHWWPIAATNRDSPATAGGSGAVSKRKFEELTQDEIDARAAAIRAEWPDWRWRKEEPGEPPVDLPVVKLDKRRNGVLM